MKNESYYVYSAGILGVKTNIKDFKWVYGSVAPLISQDEFEKCSVRLDVNIKPEKELEKIEDYDKKFQSYHWDKGAKKISLRRKLLGKIEIGYDITLTDDGAVVEMGKNYYNLIKKRVMNLHDAYYLLSDLANVLLLKKGYVTLYSSAVYHTETGKGIVCFAPPNTGKTVTATKLCERGEYSLIGEDIVLYKDGKLFACPYTASYRGKKSLLDSSGALGRVEKTKIDGVCDRADATTVFVLTNGKGETDSDKEEVIRQIAILNGYLFNYSSSPIVKILGYFDPDHSEDWNAYAMNMLKMLADKSECYVARSKNALEFSEIVHKIVTGEDK